jgi:hypothetical protein
MFSQPEIGLSALGKTNYKTIMEHKQRSRNVDMVKIWLKFEGVRLRFLYIHQLLKTETLKLLLFTL